MLHATLERYLRSLPKDPDQWPVVPVITANLANPPLNDEQIIAVEDCYSYLVQVMKPLLGPSLQISIEERVYLQKYDPVLYECNGTCDIILMTDDQTHIIDWKFGKGIPVYAHKNDQLMAYLAGAVRDFPTLSLDRSLHIHVVQPRLDIYDHLELTADEMSVWLRSRVIPGVTRAYEKHAPFCPGQKQCRWCPAKIGCRARFNFTNQTAADIFGAVTKMKSDDDAVTSEELSAILVNAAEYEQYIKDIKEHIVHELQQGRVFDGWKMVHGRSIRRWVDEQSAEMHLGNMFDYDKLYKSKFLSPTQAEKLQRGMKKEDWFLDLVEKPEGKPTLAKESDKRQAIDYRTTSEIFGETE